MFMQMVYGTAWVTMPIVSVLGDGNSTRGELFSVRVESVQISTMRRSS
jgi:hypothetical protein